VSPDLEITLEANPNSARRTVCRLRAAGVNGCRSASIARPYALRFLGRAHGSDEAVAAIGLAERISRAIRST